MNIAHQTPQLAARGWRVYACTFNNLPIEMKRLVSVLLWLVLFACAYVHSADCDFEVKHQLIESDRGKLIQSLLGLALSKSDRTACYSQAESPMTLARKTLEAQKGNLSVVWAGSGSDIEEKLRAIRIPVFKGLVGYRLLVIRADDQARFDQVQTLKDFQSFKAGIGERWADRAALESAGIPVELSAYGRRLWPMLSSQRFDFIPYGIYEVWHQLPRWGQELTIERNLLLHYPIGFYFYVNKEDDALHAAITKGMEAAIADGSYDRLLFSSPAMQAAVTKTNLLTRRVIYLQNPDVPEDTPFDRKELWMTPAELEHKVRAMQTQGAEEQALTE